MPIAGSTCASSNVIYQTVFLLQGKGIPEKEAARMRKTIILSVLLMTHVFILGCPSGMYCEIIEGADRCIDGTWPRACISYDGTECVFEVVGQNIYCNSCDDCESAAELATSLCYGYNAAAGDFVAADEGKVIDQSFIENEMEGFMSAIALMTAMKE